MVIRLDADAGFTVSHTIGIRASLVMNSCSGHDFKGLHDFASDVASCPYLTPEGKVIYSS